MHGDPRYEAHDAEVVRPTIALHNILLRYELLGGYLLQEVAPLAADRLRADAALSHCELRCHHLAFHFLRSFGDTSLSENFSDKSVIGAKLREGLKVTVLRTSSEENVAIVVALKASHRPAVEFSEGKQGTHQGAQDVRLGKRRSAQDSHVLTRR